MSELSTVWKARLGPAVLPFERTQFTRQVLDGEDVIFVDSILTIDRIYSSGKLLTDIKLILSNDPPMQEKYLWVIDKNGLKLLPETTPNQLAARKVVCHTNITGGAKAYQGGELWFGDDGKVYINNRSGRYGADTLSQRTAVLDYFRSLGFDPVQLSPIR